MYDAVFMNSFGSNIFDTLGVLESMKSKLRNTVIYNCLGSSSILVFFKILGFTYQQTFDYLKTLDLSHTFINGYFIIPEDEEIKKDHIRNWMLEKMEINNLITEDATLQEIYKLTKIFPNFIVWSRKSNSLVSLNPKLTPNLKLLDCVLATLTGIGTFVDYTLEEDIFSNYISGNLYPHILEFKLQKRNLKTLFLAHHSRYFFQDMNNIESPFLMVENEIINQFIEANNSIVNSLELENLLIIYDDIYKKSFNDLKREFSFENGKQQGMNFNSGDCNLIYYNLRKTEIENQK